MKDKINTGSFYTPQRLCELVLKMYEGYSSPNDIIMDCGAGYGAFLHTFSDYDVKAVEIQKKCINSLNQLTNEVYYINALANPSRELYNISEEDRLVIIGNPPYNDFTSQYAQNIKSSDIIVHKNIKSRDYGISFLRMYDMLEADLVFVLHPLSYLIKERNFNSLKGFKDSYRLKQAIIFSSAEFGLTGIEFPVIATVYERGEGMTYDYIRDFQFKVLDSDTIFTLSNYETTDKYIHKYPNQNKVDDTGVYFQTFRDINSLRRSATFRHKKSNSSIFVTVDELYKYCYIDYFKNEIDTPYYEGNLSPYFVMDIDNCKCDLVKYSLNNNIELQKTINKNDELYEEICNYYGV